MFKNSRKLILAFGLVALCFLGIKAEAPQTKTYESRLGKIDIGNVNEGAIQVPFITWGGDVATFHANGGLITSKDSLYENLVWI